MCKTSVIFTRKDLLRRLPEDIIKKHFNEKEEIRAYYGKGCKICHSTGYAGRVGIFEILVVSKEIRRLITEKVDSDIIEKAAISEGMNTMLDDGLMKVAKGQTTIEEAFRATKVEIL